MQQKDKILILFDGLHLAYSPTVVQLYDALSAEYDVTITAESSKKFFCQKLSGRQVINYECVKKTPAFIYNLYYYFLSLTNEEARIIRSNKIKFNEYHSRFRTLKNILKCNAYKKVIAVDIKNLFYCSLFKQRTDFVSLEIGASETLLTSVNTSLIDCVIIQSKERFDYLFKNKNLTTFYIQNAPVFKEPEQNVKKAGLLFGGTAWNAFGFYHCLNYLKVYEEEVLTVQGAVTRRDNKKIHKEYASLLCQKRLIINEAYIDNDQLVPYFSRFEIGFCFYNFKVKWVNHFNYHSAPSGKLFKYLAAGVPVVCSDIEGFHFVNQFKCGVLIADLSPENINRAIKEIRANYREYVANAIIAAKHFSFDKAVKPYLDFVRNT